MPVWPLGAPLRTFEAAVSAWISVDIETLRATLRAFCRDGRSKATYCAAVGADGDRDAAAVVAMNRSGDFGLVLRDGRLIMDADWFRIMDVVRTVAGSDLPPSRWPRLCVIPRLDRAAFAQMMAVGLNDYAQHSDGRSSVAGARRFARDFGYYAVSCVIDGAELRAVFDSIPRRDESRSEDYVRRKSLALARIYVDRFVPVDWRSQAEASWLTDWTGVTTPAPPPS